MMQFSVNLPGSAVLTGLSVSGYKAAIEQTSIHVGALTLLAGANSSGKSSIMQPMLLLKQTLEATVDPGPLQIDGPNVYFTSAQRQMFSRRPDGTRVRGCRFGFTLSDGSSFSCDFSVMRSGRVGLSRMIFVLPDTPAFALADGMSREQILKALPAEIRAGIEDSESKVDESVRSQMRLSVRRTRCLLYLQYGVAIDGESAQFAFSTNYLTPTDALANVIIRCIHVPSFRSIEQRLYPFNETGATFPGEFDSYVGSVLEHWQRAEPEKLVALGRDLGRLGFATKITTTRSSDVDIDILVNLYGRRRKIDKEPMVSVADVGFGVSQVLPVLVALRVATPHHLVYVEEPESHLHPRAQLVLAAIIAESVARGTRVIIETHSSLLLLGIQAALARGELDSGGVQLYWFTRTAKGTHVTRAVVGSDGSYGPWPVDFDDVLAGAQKAYIDSAFGDK